MRYASERSWPNGSLESHLTSHLRQCSNAQLHSKQTVARSYALSLGVVRVADNALRHRFGFLAVPLHVPLHLRPEAQMHVIRERDSSGQSAQLHTWSRQTLEALGPPGRPQ